jgi:3-oxoacyl-[acyl-carrier-protein] synthase II
MKRVVITGIGAVTPTGVTFQACWEAVKAGRSGIRNITKFDPLDIPWKVAGELKVFEANAYLSQKELNRLDPFVHYAVAASVMASEDSGLLQKAEVRRHRRAQSSSPISGIKINHVSHPSTQDYLNSGGVIIGSSRGGISTLENAMLSGIKSEYRNLKLRQSTRKMEPGTHKLRLSPFLMPATTVSMASSYVAQALGIKGYCLGISNACASGANAIGEAYRLLKAGFKGPVLAGGAEAPVCRLCVEGYGASGALSKGTDCFACRPFDSARNGFVLSEGACMLMLEDYDNCLKRGAHIYGEIIGYGNTTDAFHITRPDPEGEARAMMMAINEAGLTSDKVDYINTHGTATRIGDIAEAQAIKMVFGKRASTIPATAIKSMTGHILAASGALEIALTLISMKTGVIPPTINLDQKDTLCNLNIITKRINDDIRISISNSFGFGGVNAVLLLKRL